MVIFIVKYTKIYFQSRKGELLPIYTVQAYITQSALSGALSRVPIDWSSITHLPPHVCRGATPAVLTRNKVGCGQFEMRDIRVALASSKTSQSQQFSERFSKLAVERGVQDGIQCAVQIPQPQGYRIQGLRHLTGTQWNKCKDGEVRYPTDDETPHDNAEQFCRPMFVHASAWFWRFEDLA